MIEKPGVQLNERTQLLDNVYTFKHNKRVPLGSNIWSWQVLDCGYKQSTALENYDIAEKINREFHERYDFDIYINLITRNPKRVTDLTGGGSHWIDENDENIQCNEHYCMEPDEYDELINSPVNFYWSKAFPRFTKYQDNDYRLTYGNLKQALSEWAEFNKYSAKMTDININEYGALMYYSNFCQAPFETIMGNLRGLTGSSSDLRRKKTELVDAIQQMDETILIPAIKQALAADWTGYVAPITVVFIAHSILNPKQFETFYWPSLKKVFDAAVSNNKRIFGFSESFILRLSDFFADIPRGIMMMHLEQDDIFDFRKVLPNIAIAGGMTTAKLGGSSKDECTGYAKYLIDELGEGYVLCQNKMLSYRNDCRRENLLAVIDFVKNYEY